MLGAKTCRLAFGATVLLCAFLYGGVLSAQTPQYRVESRRSFYRYYIHPGDILQISVYQHPELSKTVVVMPISICRGSRLRKLQVYRFRLRLIY
jgi:protein involved in polysaccharide export with SLBB domain